MRKLFVAVAALGMLLTSCAKDADVVTGGNESMVTINVAQPELSTRAATGTKDAEDQYGTGITAEALQYAIFEVKDGKNEKRLVREDLDFFAGDILKGSLTERLVNGKTYVAVFWADVAKDKYYTVDWDNGTISLKDATALNAQNEELDAFWGMTDEFRVDGPVTVSATLKRPFAQLNISTCDTDVAAAAGLVVEKSSLTVSNVYTAFNFWSGEVDANSETEIEFKSAVIPDSYYYEIEGTKYDVLSLNYLLVNDKKNVDVVFQYEGSGLDFEREFTAVPVQRNHRTHIIGNLLTDVATINIEIDPMFEDPDHLVDADLLHAFQYGGAVELTRDVVLSAPLEMLNDVETTINLNGHTITYANPDEESYTAVFMVKKGTLTIEGEGDVVAEGEGNIAVWAGRGDAENDGKVIIKGGNFSNTTSQELIYTTNKGIIEIYGGTFQVAEEDQESFAEPQYPVLNLYGNGKTGNDIIVYGGTFYNFNPADNVSENPKKNFVADGHASIASTDAEGNNIYTVVEAKQMEGLTVAALGYQNAKLSWTAVDGADHYKVSYGTWTSDEITGTEYADMPVETVKDSRKPVFQVVAYDANGSTLAMGQTAGDVEIFTLFERPEPKITLANGKLTLANAELYNPNPSKDYPAPIIDNIHLYGVLLEAEVEFYKDGAATPAHVAKGTFTDSTGKTYANLKTGIENDNPHKIKNNIVGPLTKWKWNGATEATATAPAFEPGTYTIKYIAYYYPVLGASYGQDRITGFPDGGVLQTLIAREGEVEGSFSIASVEGIAAARNGYKGIEVTWNAVQGATSYEVVADGQKATVSETKAQFTAADTQHSFTNFSVTALDANGAVVAVGNLAAETQVWTLAGMPEPNITFDGSTLKVTNVLDVMAVCVDITIDFKKDGVVAHTASYNKVSSAYGWNGSEMSHITSGRFTNGMFADFVPSAATSQPNWVWNGAENATAPSFEPGEYTIEYTASYWPIVNGYWADSDKKPTSDPTKYNRVMFDGKDDDVLKHTETDAQMVKTGTAANTYSVGFNAEAKALVDAVELSWNPVGSSTYEIYVDGTKVDETAETSYTYQSEGVKSYNFEIKVKGSTVSATASAAVEWTMAGWQAPVVTFNKQADGKYEMLVSNMLTLTYGYQGGTITLKKDGQVVHTLTHTFGTTLWSWASWRRFIYTNFVRESWKLDGSESEARYHSLTPGTYTVEYDIDYVAIKDAGYATAAANYGANITWADEASATMICFEAGVEALLWVSRGVSTGTNGSIVATGAVPYTVNKKGTFTGTYTIE